jgi:hypothetical protein
MKSRPSTSEMQLWDSPDFPDTDVRCKDDLSVLGECHRGTRDRRRAEDEESASIADANECAAGIANRNIGRLFATCTIETRNGSESRLAMSQPETRYIHAPIFETTVAVQIAAYALW